MKKAGKLTSALVVVFCILVFSATVMAEGLCFEVSKKAELKKVTMYIKKIRKKATENAVIFEITVKNIDSVPHLYRVLAVIPGVGGAGGFVPAKGGKKLASQAEGVTSLGIICPEFPKVGYMIKVEEIEMR